MKPPETSDQVQDAARRRARLVTLGGILIVALAARAIGITYGLPYLFYHHDEPQIVLRALRFGTGDFNPHIFWWPGTFQMDLMFLVYAAMFAVERLLGMVVSSQDFAASYFRDPGRFYLAGRLATLVFALGTVGLVIVLAKRTHTWAVGAVAALLLAVNAMHVEWSRLVLPVVPMVFWVVLAFLASLRIIESRQARWYLAAGAATGLAAGCLYYGGVVAIVIPVAHWLATRRERLGWRAALSDWRPYGGLAAVAAAFVAVCPYAVLDWQGFRQDIVSTYFGYARWESGGASGLPAYLAGCLAALARSLVRALGVPVLVAALAGLALSLRRRTPESILTAVFVLGYLAILGFSSGHRGRHMAPVVPMLTILAATVIVKLAGLVRGARRPAALAILSAAIALPSALEVARIDSEFVREDTRIQAKRWVEATLPAGTRIVLDASSYRNTATAPLEETDENIQRRIADLKTGRARGYGYTPAYLKYYEMMLEHRRVHGPQYDQWWTEFGTNTRPVDWFGRNGYNYAMVSSIVTERYYDESFSERLAASTPFYRDLDSLGVLLETFEPRPWTRPGPTLKVYRIPEAGQSADVLNSGAAGTETN